MLIIVRLLNESHKGEILHYTVSNTIKVYQESSGRQNMLNVLCLQLSSSNIWSKLKIIGMKHYSLTSNFKLLIKIFKGQPAFVNESNKSDEMHSSNL